MRPIPTLAVLLVPSLAFAQPCGPYQAAYTWNELPSGLIYFDNMSAPENVGTFIWDFGDGSPTASSFNAEHYYAEPGIYEVCLTGTWDNCTSVSCAEQAIGGDPCALLQVGFATTTTPNGVQFTNSTSGGGENTAFSWNFGDGTFGDAAQPFHTYAGPGVYTVCLLATTEYTVNDVVYSCAGDHCATVIVEGGDPCADLEACFIPLLGGGNVVSFNNCSQPGTNTQYEWYFGDGTNGSGASPIHTYAPGTYTACLVAYWNNCVDEFCLPFTIEGVDPCAEHQACFVTNALPNNAYFFDNCSSGPANTQYVWTFGDGTSSTTEHGEHTYAQPGVYEVCLTIYWENCSDSTCTVVTVGDPAPCSPNFHVEMAWNAGGDGEVFFNATSTFPQTNFIWYFADGTEGDGAAVTHTYDDAGSYSVCVSGWYWNESTNDTCWTEDCELVVVESNGPCGGLEACFTTSELPNNGFFFENCSTDNGGALSYEWSYGDGAVGTSINGEHHYAQPGTYTVCLTVHWGDCSETTCHTVNIEGPCDALFANFGSVISGNSVSFENATTGTGISTTWYWDFGDGGSSSAENPDHAYASAGEYPACLTATTIFNGSNGQLITCQDTYCFEIHAFGGTSCDALQAGFFFTPNANGIQFSNTTVGTGQQTSFLWTFGDDQTSNDAQPFHTYAAPGTYEVCLTATTIYIGPDGQALTCMDTQCGTVIVQGGGECDGLVACFEALPLENGVYLFDNCSTDPIPAQYAWNFGDGTTSTANSPDHAFLPGTYTVCLTVYWGSCTDETCTTVTVPGVDPCAGLIACFEALPFENGAYHFENCSQLLPINTPAYYAWNFGDGGTSDAAQPDHAFATGTWTVCLTVTHGNCVDETCTTITVINGPGCDPNYSTEFTWTSSGTATIFAATANVPTVGYIWHFGDGSDEDYGNVITHLYEPPGPYEVCLDAWYWNQATEDTCWTYRCHLVDPFSTVGIADITTDDISLFPVPATDLLTITGLSANTRLDLFAADGRLVLSGLALSTTHSMDVSGLAKGGYVLRIATQHGALHRKVLVE